MREPARVARLLALAMVGCSSAHFADAGPRDAGAVDSGAVDSGAVDSGERDAGEVDAGPPNYRLEGAVVEGDLYGGGATGPNVFELLCGPTEIVVGHDGGSDSDGYPDWYTLHCAELLPDGTVGGERLTPTIAAEAGTCGSITGPWVQRCPDGMLPVGVHGSTVRFRTGQEIVGRLGLTCAPLASWLRDGTGAQLLSVTTNSTTVAVREFDERCDPGYLLTQVTGYSGCLVDALRIGCRHVAN